MQFSLTSALVLLLASICLIANAAEAVAVSANSKKLRASVSPVRSARTMTTDAKRSKSTHSEQTIPAAAELIHRSTSAVEVLDEILSEFDRDVRQVASPSTLTDNDRAAMREFCAFIAGMIKEADELKQVMPSAVLAMKRRFAASECRDVL